MSNRSRPTVGNIDIAKIKILSDEKATVYYRIGFAYRGAKERIIQKNEVENLLKKNRWLDIEQTSIHEWHINEYSENDMF